MRKICLMVLVAALVCLGGYGYAQDEGIDCLAEIEPATEPASEVSNLLRKAAQWIVDHGEIAYLYDLGDSDRGSEMIAKLTLYTAFDLLTVDAAATIPVEAPDEAPGLGGGVGVKLSGILEKFNKEWTQKWDVSAGYLGGYRFDEKKWMHGPALGVSVRF